MIIRFPKEARGPRMPVDGPDRRFMALASYLGGDFHVCGTKWYGSNIENPTHGLPRSILLVIINLCEDKLSSGRNGEPSMMKSLLMNAFVDVRTYRSRPSYTLKKLWSGHQR